VPFSPRLRWRLDTAIANIALPAIAADLHADPADVIWVVNVYQVAMAATLLPLAVLGEVVGRYRTEAPFQRFSAVG
jgi:MFS transporter, DHA2 family, multidrug resistance protein